MKLGLIRQDLRVVALYFFGAIFCGLATVTAIECVGCSPAVQADAVAVKVDAIAQAACIDRVPVTVCADVDASDTVACVWRQQIAMEACRAEVRKHRDAGGDR